MGRVSDELGQRVYLDTNIIIYAVEGFSDAAVQIQALLTAMDNAEIVAVTSALTLAEVLVKPFKDQNQAVAQAYKTFLTPTPVLQLIPITNNILEEAARVRATTRLKLPDAIHTATARINGCNSFLTNDDSFDSFTAMTVKKLSATNLI
jgi:predicted nucleic acid-binding protein